MELRSERLREEGMEKGMKENSIRVFFTMLERGYAEKEAQEISGLSDEEADDIFCERMMENYLKDLDPEKDDSIPLEKCMKEWGIPDV